MSYKALSPSLLFLLFSFTSLAHADDLGGRSELNWRLGTERSILMNEYWVPLSQGSDRVLYTDLRFMGDDGDNHEFNLGLGYRNIVMGLPVLGDGVVGIHGWFDRRISEHGSQFNQLTSGVEWFGTAWDLKLNGYLPLNDTHTFTQANANSGASFVGNQIVVDTDQVVQEKALAGLDFEIGWNAAPLVGGFSDSTRVYVGGYHFGADDADDITGWRTRIASDITSDFQLGARFQKDDERGSQGFLEATVRFPFGQKQSFRKQGLHARLDESPERDIDVVTGDKIIDKGDNIALVNKASGQTQNVIHVDNSAAGGGTGTAESPFNTLADAEAAASDNTLIYVHSGTGTSTNQDSGITLSHSGMMLIGSGANLTYNNSRFETANGQNVSSKTLIAAAGTAPVITNTAGDGITLGADDITISGLSLQSASGDGIVTGNANNVVIDSNVINSSGGSGIVVLPSNAGQHNMTITNNTITNSGALTSANGIYVIPVGTVSMNILVDHNTVTDSSHQGIWLESVGNSTMTSVISNNIIANNNQAGILVGGQGDSTHTTTIFGNVSYGNAFGVDYEQAFGTNNSRLYANTYDNEFYNSLYYGINLNADVTAQGDFKFSHNWIHDNGQYAWGMMNYSSGTINIDFGGGVLGSTGQNSIYNSGIADIGLDIGNYEIKAENNWWGTAAGLLPAQLDVNTGATVDADPYLDQAPTF